MNRLINTAIFTAALCATVGCATQERDYESINDLFSKDREITASEDKVMLESPIGDIQHNSFIDGSTLYLQSYNSGPGPEILAIEINSGKTLTKVLPRGRGRNESAQAFLIDQSDDKIVCFDQNKQSVLTSTTDEIMKPTPKQKWETKHLDWDGLFSMKWRFQTISGDRYIFGRCGENGLFDVMNSDLEVINSFGEYKRVDGDEIDQMGNYQGYFTTTTSKDRFAYVLATGNVIYFGDSSDADAEPRILKQYYIDPPLYNIDRENGLGISTSEFSIMGTLSTTASDKNFYLLNLSKSVQQVYDEYETNGSFDGSNTVLVFDRDGNPVERLILDRGVHNINYCEENNSLYSLISNDEGDHLIRFEL